jgi:type IV secretory pathway VirB6-like protein
MAAFLQKKIMFFWYQNKPLNEICKFLGYGMLLKLNFETNIRRVVLNKKKFLYHEEQVRASEQGTLLLSFLIGLINSAN